MSCWVVCVGSVRYSRAILYRDAYRSEVPGWLWLYHMRHNRISNRISFDECTVICVSFVRLAITESWRLISNVVNSGGALSRSNAEHVGPAAALWD